MRAYLAALMIIVVSTLALQGRPARTAEPTAAGLWQQVSKSTGKPDAWFLVSERNGLYAATLVKIFVKSAARPNPLCTECSVRMWLSPNGQSLTVRGYLGIDPLGGDETWRRLPHTAFNKINPPLAARAPTLTAESGVTSPKSDHAKSR
jgi:hypothetical protein